MNGHRIAAIPTMYRGRQYRSRLEAKWAAFFDLMKWRAEYEPYELGRWSPDFAMADEAGCPVLVEVKPILSFDRNVAKKMEAASTERGRQDYDTLLLIGVSPTAMGCGVRIGWVGQHCGEPESSWAWLPALLAWVRDPSTPRLLPDILHHDHTDDSGRLYMRGILTGIHACEDSVGLYHEEVMRLWAAASNCVQWRAPRG
jgi:hypothetical protein